MIDLTKFVCLVTGASRGIGKGIAIQLGHHGAKVYITGRSEEDLLSCAAEITANGGNGIAVVVDHNKDVEVEALFRKISLENSNRLDLLVNNAYSGVKAILENEGKNFWETDGAKMWDAINGVGLRGHYLCTVLASRLMVPHRSGLIVNISSFGGIKYFFNVAYGVGKAGCDRMAADCSFELRKHNVAMISLWPGAVKTENIIEHVLDNISSPESIRTMFAMGESPEFSGQAIVHLLNDPNLMKKSGKILLNSDLAEEFGFYDKDGLQHEMRGLALHLQHLGYSKLAWFIPKWIKIPLFILHMVANKF